MKTWLLSLLALLLIISTAGGQTTVVNSSLRGMRPLNGTLLGYSSAGYSEYTSTSGSASVQRDISADSLPDQRWSITLGDSLGPGTWEASVSGFLIRGDLVLDTYSYTDTVNLGAGPGYINVPDRLKDSNRAAPMLNIVPRVGAWRVPFKAAVARGTRVDWRLTRIVPISVDSAGVLNTNATIADSVNTY